MRRIRLDFGFRALVPSMGNQNSQTFASFFQAGFECSSHRRRDGVRLDLIRATSHDRHLASDYRQCADLGLKTLRDGLRWHLIEQTPGQYDWSSWLPALEAAERLGVQIIWDIFHYGSPNHVDQAAPDFPERFAEFAVAAVSVQQSVSRQRPILCLLNEISFLCWAVETGYFPRVGPDEHGWLKRQLVKAGIAAAKAIRAQWPEAMFIWAEPLIHVAPKHGGKREIAAAEERRLTQFEAYDLLTGRAEPELGGQDDFVDLVGLNFYPHNQWYLDGPTIPMGHHEYRPLASMLGEVAERYGKPLFLAETGAEGSARPAWLHYVCDEVRQAQAEGAGIEGICLYPITSYPGWDNSRHCHVGLFSTVGSDGKRHVYEPLRQEMERQRAIFGVDRAVEEKARRLRLAR